MVQPTHKQLGIIIGILSAIGGLTALLVYLENRQNKLIKDQLLLLDKELKLLQIQKTKKELNGAS